MTMGYYYSIESHLLQGVCDKDRVEFTFFAAGPSDDDASVPFAVGTTVMFSNLDNKTSLSAKSFRNLHDCKKKAHTCTGTNRLNH